jgi:hypothetical protein
MKICLVLLMALAVCSCSSVPFDPRLNGTWLSNRDETVAAVFASDNRWKTAAVEKVEAFKNSFGKLQVTFDGCRVTTRCGDHTEHFTYKVVSSRDNTLEIETKSNGQTQRHRIEFTKDNSGYWVNTPMGHKEKFDRISPP